MPARLRQVGPLLVNDLKAWSYNTTDEVDCRQGMAWAHPVFSRVLSGTRLLRLGTDTATTAVICFVPLFILVGAPLVWLYEISVGIAYRMDGRSWLFLASTLGNEDGCCF